MGGTCVWRVVFLAVFMGTFVARAALGMLAEEWTYAAVQLLALDFFALLTGVGVLAQRRARETERATLRRGS